MEAAAQKIAKFQFARAAMPLFTAEHVLDQANRAHHLRQLPRFEGKHVIGAEILSLLEKIAHGGLAIEGDVLLDHARSRGRRDDRGEQSYGVIGVSNTRAGITLCED